MSVILPQNFKIKPAMWMCDPGIVAYNCARLGLPIPWDLRAIWEGAGNKILNLGDQKRDGTFVVGEEPTWENSELGPALKFSGAQKVSAAAADLSPLGANCSLLVWASCDTANPNYECAYNYRTNAGNNDLIGVFLDDSTHQIHWWAGGGSGENSSGNQWVTSKLHCFIVTHDSEGLGKLYVDGRLAHTSSGKTWATNTSPVMYWGKYVENSLPLNGNISLSAIWNNHTLTFFQVAALYNNRYAMLEPIRSPAIWSTPAVGVAPTGAFYGPLYGPLGGSI